jgi:hypothetical protein
MFHFLISHPYLNSLSVWVSQFEEEFAKEKELIGLSVLKSNRQAESKTWKEN